MFSNIKRLKLWVLILPFLLFGMGSAMNISVISVNHGMMPVMVPSSFTELSQKPGTIMDDSHIVYDPGHVHFRILIDWITVPHLGVYSPGDMFIYLGLWLEDPCIIAWCGLALLGKLE